jgi:uncharacterized protein (UPF0248 family)
MNYKPVLFSLLIASVLMFGCAGPQSPQAQVPTPQPQVTPPPPAPTPQPQAPPAPSVFNTKGNVLISDQYNNRVIEVDPLTNKIVWSFGSNNPALCNPGPGTTIGTNWAERLPNGLTLIAGTGIPSCADNRVIVVNQAGTIVWQYGQANVTGSGANQLNVPVAAIELPNGNIMITDQGNNRIIEVNSTGQIVWSYGPSSPPGQLNSPNSAQLLENGNVLIADENNNRAIEVARNGSMEWEYNGSISDNVSLNAVAFASRLPDNNTLIVDSGNARILMVSRDRHAFYQYYTNTENGSNVNPLPTNAVLISTGKIMIISDEMNHRVFAIDHAGNVVWQYGITNVSGNGPGELNGPYTAFVIGDYTGQTPPQ